MDGGDTLYTEWNDTFVSLDTMGLLRGIYTCGLSAYAPSLS